MSTTQVAKLSKDERDMIVSGLHLLSESARRQTNNAANSEKLKEYHNEVYNQVLALKAKVHSFELAL